MRVLIRGPNWLGDLAMSLPLFDSLRDYHPFILVKHGLGELLKPYGEVITFRNKNELFRISLSLRRYGFDIGIVIPPSFSSALFTRLAKVKIVIGYSTEFRSFLLTHPLRSTLRQKHYVYEVLDLIKAVRLKVKPPTVVKPRFQEDYIDVLDGFMSKIGLQKGKYFVIAPFAKFGDAKEWTLDSYIEVAKRIQKCTGLVPVFVGSKEETRRLETDIGINLVGKTDLNELLYILLNSAIVIGNDSGITHLADIHGVKNIMIFGPTSPRWTGSLSGRNLYLGLDCSPCNKPTCPLKHHNCMRNLESEDVLATCLELLNTNASS